MENHVDPYRRYLEAPDPAPQETLDEHYPQPHTLAVREEVERLFHAYGANVQYGWIHCAPSPSWRDECVVDTTQSRPRFATRLHMFERIGIPADTQSAGRYLGFLSLRPPEGDSCPLICDYGFDYVLEAELAPPRRMLRPRYHLILTTASSPRLGVLPFRSAIFIAPRLDESRRSTCMHMAVSQALHLTMGRFGSIPISQREFDALLWRSQNNLTMDDVTKKGANFQEALLVIKKHCHAGGFIASITNAIYGDDTNVRHEALRCLTDTLANGLAVIVMLDYARLPGTPVREFEEGDLDLRRCSQLERRILQGQDSISRQLRDVHMKELLASPKASGKSLQAVIVRGLNRALDDTDLKNIGVKKKIGRLIGKSAREVNTLRRDNRLLLEAAYPGEIDKLQNIHAALLFGMHLVHAPFEIGVDISEALGQRYREDLAELPGRLVGHDILHGPFFEWSVKDLLDAAIAAYGPDDPRRGVYFLAIGPRRMNIGLDRVRQLAIESTLGEQQALANYFKSFHEPNFPDLPSPANWRYVTRLIEAPEVLDRYFCPVQGQSELRSHLSKAWGVSKKALEHAGYYWCVEVRLPAPRRSQGEPPPAILYLCSIHDRDKEWPRVVVRWTDKRDNSMKLLYRGGSVSYQWP